jgi:hypothetical protein
LPVREVWHHFARDDFTNALYVLGKKSGLFANSNKPENIENILKRKSGVDALLELKDKDA